MLPPIVMNFDLDSAYMYSHPPIEATEKLRSTIELQFRPNAVPCFSQAVLNASRACSTQVCMNSFKRNNLSCQHAKFAYSRDACYNHAAVIHHHREKTAWTKARVQHIRTRPLRQNPINSDMNITARLTAAIATPSSAALSLKRKQVAFVKAQELESMLAAHVGTPHMSELQHDEDVVPHVQMEGLGAVTCSDALCGLDVRNGCRIP